VEELGSLSKIGAAIAFASFLAALQFGIAGWFLAMDLHIGLQILMALTFAAIGAAIATAFATAGVSVGAAAAALAAAGIATAGFAVIQSKMNKKTEEGVKSTKRLGASHVASTKFNKEFTVANNKFNTSLDTTSKTTKKLTEDQKKALEVQKAIKQQFGITTAKGEDDPIQLEAARLNLIKQQALGIEALTQNQYAFIEAQFASNVQAQRYADILAVINDNKISSSELDALAYKWGKSREFVLKYIQEVTGINNIVIGKDLGLDAANSWENAKKKLDEYLKSLQATGQVSPQTQAVISQIDQATADALAASDAALAAAERARKANEKFADAGIFPGAFPRSNPGDFRAAEERSNATGPIISTPIMGAVAGFTPTSQYGAIPTSGAIAGPSINVTVNAGNVIGSSAALVDTVRQGILAGQSSGNIISYNPLDI
jgi:hypothetical protein